jgi:triphosphoribosyl-dephospho-CoA synthase
MISSGTLVRWAILLESTSPKLGNVYPGRPFMDMTHEHFARAATALGEVVDSIPNGTVGELADRMAAAMMDTVGVNTSLGTILLLAPLVVARRNSPRLDRDQVRQVLNSATPLDSELVYRAIARAKPNGLGQSESMDVHGAAPKSLLEAMSYASTYDDVALQYVSDFELVWIGFEDLELCDNRSLGDLRKHITHLQLRWLASRPDSLIARKAGRADALLVQQRAIALLNAHDSITIEQFNRDWLGLDAWMRESIDSHGKQLRNPGTMADLIAAVIFVWLNQRCDQDDSIKTLLLKL